MTVIVKSKTYAKAKSKTKPNYAAIVDEMGLLKTTLDAMKEASDRYNKLRNDLRTFIPEETSPAEVVEFSGEEYVARFSAARRERSVTDLKALHELMGDAFYTMVSVSMSAVDASLTLEEKAKLVSETYGTTRNCTMVHK